MSRLYLTFARRAPAIVSIAVILTLLTLPQVAQLRVHHESSDYLPPADDPEMARRELFRTRFGAGRQVIAALDFGEPMTALHPWIIEGVVHGLRDLDFVEQVTCLSDAIGFEWVMGKSAPYPLLVVDVTDSTAFQEGKRRFDAEPVYAGSLVSHDWTTAALLIEFDDDSVPRIGELETLLREYGEGIYESHLAGTALLNRALEAGARRDVLLFGITSAALSLILMGCLFRRMLPVVLAGVIALISLVWTLCLMATAGQTISAGLAMVVPLVIVISVAFSAHYLTRAFMGASGSTAWAYLAMMQGIWPPSMMTGITTGIGFLSLALSPLRSVRELGIWVGLGAIICMLTSSIVLPSVLWLLRRHWTSRTGTRYIPLVAAGTLSRFVASRSRFVIMASLLVTAAFGLGSLRITLDADPLSFFGDDSELLRAYRLVDEKLGGTITTEIMVERDREAVRDLVHRMGSFGSRLREIEGIGSVVSAADFLLMADRVRPADAGSLANPESGQFPQRFWDAVRERGYASRYVWGDSNFVALRIAVRSHAQGTTGLRAVLDEIQQAIASELPGERVQVSGQGPVLLRVYDYMVETQVTAFLWAFGLVFILMFLFLRNWRLVGTAVVVNLLPIVILLGTMGWLGVRLDIATIMIASIALGMIVDDTVHYLHRCSLLRASGMAAREATEETFRRVGPALVTTSILLAGGFLTLAVSDFMPTRHFGILSAMTIVAAFGADVVLLPALLMLGTERTQSD